MRRASVCAAVLFQSAVGFVQPRLGRASYRAAVTMAFDGPRQKLIEQQLTEALKPSYLEVVNESHGRQEDESHVRDARERRAPRARSLSFSPPAPLPPQFFTCVVSDSFEGVKLIERHRMVNAILAGEDGTLPFHALRITAKTPEQWSASSNVPKAPKCAGGDGRGMLK